MKINYSGISATDRYLTVYVTVEQGSWLRFAEVKVPIQALLDQRVTDAMDTAVRRSLIQQWSEVDLSDPLF